MSPEIAKVTAPDGFEVRKFSDGALQAQIDAALARTDNFDNGVVIEVAVTEEHTALTVVGKSGPHWSVVGVLDKPKDQPIGIGGAIRYRW